MRPALEAFPEQIKAILRNPVDFAQTFIRWEDGPLRLDGWQVAFLQNLARYRALEKSVQVGFSWLCALEAFHRGFVYPDQDAAFVSVSETEAKNKLHYIEQMMDGLWPDLLRMVPCPTHSKEEVQFGTGQGASRLVSRPASSTMRGIAAHIYLDEVDHMREDKDTFTSAMGRTTRKRRRLTLGSSVLGEDTALSRIMAPGKYPSFLKARLPWWVAENPETLADILDMRANMPEEDFAQEYECSRSLVENTLFPQDLIRSRFHERRMRVATEVGPSGQLAAGFDPGGAGHPAALSVLHLYDGHWSQIVLERIRDKSLTAQENYLVRLLERCAGLRLAIDPGGVGKQMADHLAENYGDRVTPRVFTVASKHDMSVNLRTAMESDLVRIARDQPQVHQLNQTRRLPGGKIDQPKMGKRTHYDEFWSLALAASLVTDDDASVYADRGLVVLDMFGEDE